LSNPRANLGQILVAVGGVLLAVFTFMSWFGPGDDASAWKVFSAVDIVIFFGALLAAGLAVVNLLGQSSNLPPQLTSVQRWIGAVPALLAIAFIIEIVAGDAEIKFGGFLALLVALVLLAGTIMLVRPDIAAKVEQATANIGTGTPGPGGPGAGPGAPGAGPVGGTPGYGAQQPQAPAAPAQAPATPPGAGPASPTPAPGPASPTPPGGAGEQATAAQPAAGGESGGPAAGWYPDPQGQKRLRYWDGGRWTEQTAD
jgi:Protein of unknown function (DUF2510)